MEFKRGCFYYCNCRSSGLPNSWIDIQWRSRIKLKGRVGRASLDFMRGGEFFKVWDGFIFLSLLSLRVNNLRGIVFDCIELRAEVGWSIDSSLPPSLSPAPTSKPQISSSITSISAPFAIVILPRQSQSSLAMPIKRHLEQYRSSTFNSLGNNHPTGQYHQSDEGVERVAGTAPPTWELEELNPLHKGCNGTDA